MDKIKHSPIINKAKMWEILDKMKNAKDCASWIFKEQKKHSIKEVAYDTGINLHSFYKKCDYFTDREFTADEWARIIRSTQSLFLINYMMKHTPYEAHARLSPLDRAIQKRMASIIKPDDTRIPIL